MIVEFSIKNFGSFKDKQTISFEADKSLHLVDQYIIEPIPGLRLLKLLLIYGQNASGKTTVLKALEFLRDLVLEPVEKKTQALNFEPFLFDAVTPKESSTLSIDFIQNNTRYKYHVEFNKQAILSEELNFFVKRKIIPVFNRHTDIENQFVKVNFDSKINMDKVFEKTLASNTIWNNTVLAGFLKTNIESTELKDASSWFNDYLRALVGPNTELDGYVLNRIQKSEISKEILLSILKKADFGISDIIIREEEKDIPEGFIEFLERNRRADKDDIEELKNKGKVTAVSVESQHTIDGVHYMLPLDSESAGTQRYFSFAGLLALLLTKPVAFPIDELEASLHPDLFKHFILSFIINAKNSQVLATTHNREILNNKDIFRNDAIWFADKNADASTKLYSLSDFDSKVVRDTTSVYNAYRIGKLGAVPNLGDYYIDVTQSKQ